MCSVTIRADFNIRKGKVSRLQGEKTRMSKMLTNSEGCNLLSYKLIHKCSLCSSSKLCTNPFLFFLDLTSSAEKEFSFMIQTGGG